MLEDCLEIFTVLSENMENLSIVIIRQASNFI